jgi:hypothetical protein
MTATAKHSPAPWGYEYSPYTVRGPGTSADAVGTEIPAFQVFDAAGNKVFDSNEDTPSAIQEANARLAIAAPAMLSACRMVVARWERGDLAEAARACGDAIAQADASPSPQGGTHGKRPYSVLLLYPDYANDSGTETYYAFVDAADPIDAVTQAQRQASEAQDGIDIEPDDFAALLVTQGHPCSEALFNK